MSANPPVEASRRARVDRVGLVALLVGAAIIAWSGVLVRFLDVGPLAGAAWRLREKLDAPTATLWSAAVSAAVLTVAALLRGETMIPSTPLGWATVVLLGIVSHAIGQGLTSLAIGRTPVGIVALVILARPPVSALLAWGVLGEAMTGLQLAGGAIILAAVVMSRPA